MKLDFNNTFIFFCVQIYLISQYNACVNGWLPGKFVPALERLNAVKRQLNLAQRLADAGQLDTACDLASALMRDSNKILDDTLLVVRTENATQQQRNN